MKEKELSRTALRAAAYRAVHQVLDGGSILADPFACAMLGSEGICAYPEAAADHSLRLYIAARSRFAEDRLAAAVERGVRQAVILGAGLDTFSLRNPYAELGLRVFEADHPSTQLWKKRRLRDAGIVAPPSLSFVPLDLERQDLIAGLAASGFAPTEPAFFQWLGVVPYLKPETVSDAIRSIAAIHNTDVVFDYSEPLENYPSDRTPAITAFAAYLAEIGEPWLCFFDPSTLRKQLQEYGFTEVEDLGVSEIARRYIGGGFPVEEGPGPHLVRAARIPAE